MISRYLVVVASVTVAAIPTQSHAQSERSLPPAGSYGISFGLPDGGGSSFGIRKLLSETTNGGLDFQFGLRRLEYGGTDLRDPETLVGFGVVPSVRLYRREFGDVVPFLEVHGAVVYQKGAVDSWAASAAVGTGLGVEWFPVPGMSVSGSVGIEGTYDHVDAGTVTRTGYGVTTRRSELSVNLYF
ncbi:MAG: hypothetical protein OEZ65_09805 [Gemmatimonadota bacterium]|nr:hypothetical protein [Gemmatimonadota bacterium]MDH5759871.1 hypothetical protein [Gemmatimonadota bacterium]